MEYRHPTYILAGLLAFPFLFTIKEPLITQKYAQLSMLQLEIVKNDSFNFLVKILHRIDSIDFKFTVRDLRVTVATVADGFR